MDGNERANTIISEIYDNHSSEFYDHHAKRGEIGFYVGSAVDSSCQVLEIGCGTGRVLIPTAEAGISITGLDKSEEMLKICAAKLEGEPVGVRNRVDLVNADMRSFNLKKRYSLVTSLSSSGRAFFV